MLITLTDPVMSWEHFITAFAGATAMGLLAHAVNTFPTPSNLYGQWVLGCIKFAVGQRISAMNAFRGNDTVVVSVPQGTGLGHLASSSQVTTSHTELTPTEVKVSNEKTTKTETTVPLDQAKKGE